MGTHSSFGAIRCLILFVIIRWFPFPYVLLAQNMDAQSQKCWITLALEIYCDFFVQNHVSVITEIAKDNVIFFKQKLDGKQFCAC
jgi:hypothetical protein